MIDKEYKTHKWTNSYFLSSQYRPNQNLHTITIKTDDNSVNQNNIGKDN